MTSRSDDNNSTVIIRVVLNADLLPLPFKSWASLGVTGSEDNVRAASIAFRSTSENTHTHTHTHSYPAEFKLHMTVACIIIDCFYIALFSALEETHCAHMCFYMSE